MKSELVEVKAADICGLLGIPRDTLSDLVKRGIIVKGNKRGSYLLHPSVNRYCQHLRAQVAGRVDENVMATKVYPAHVQSETIPVANLEKRWTTELWNFRKRMFRISNRDTRSFQIYVKNGRWYTVYLK
jgi:hypothetical protein